MSRVFKTQRKLQNAEREREYYVRGFGGQNMVLPIKETTSQFDRRKGRSVGSRFKFHEASEATRKVLELVEEARSEGEKLGLEGEDLAAFVKSKQTYVIAVRKR